VKQQNLAPKIGQFSKDQVIWLLVQIGKREYTNLTYQEIAVMFVDKFVSFAPGVPREQKIAVIAKRCKHVTHTNKDVLEAPPAAPELEKDAEPETEPANDLDWVEKALKDAMGMWDKLMKSGQMTPAKMNQHDRTIKSLRQQRDELLEEQSNEEYHRRMREYHATGEYPSDYDGPKFNDLNKPSPQRDVETPDAPVQLPALSAPAEQPRQAKETTKTPAEKTDRRSIPLTPEDETWLPQSVPLPYHYISFQPSDEQIRTIIAARKRRHGFDTIAKKTGLSEDTVISILKRIADAYHRCKDGGVLSCIALAVGFQENWLRQYLTLLGALEEPQFTEDTGNRGLVDYPSGAGGEPDASVW